MLNIWKNKIHVPNHQPVCIYIYMKNMSSSVGMMKFFVPLVFHENQWAVDFWGHPRGYHLSIDGNPPG